MPSIFVIVIKNLGKFKILFSNLNYICKDCFTCFCKIPTFCKFCTSILLNEIHLAQLKEPLPIEDFENKFIGVQEMYLNFYEERLSEKKIDFVFERIVTSISISLSQFSKKESNLFFDQSSLKYIPCSLLFFHS